MGDRMEPDPEPERAVQSFTYRPGRHAESRLERAGEVGLVGEGRLDRRFLSGAVRRAASLGPRQGAALLNSGAGWPRKRHGTGVRTGNGLDP